MMNLGKFSSLLTISFLLLFGHSYAQNQDETPNRLSLGVFGTLTKGHLNVGSTFQSGINADFEFEEQFNNTIGFNIRYVATPEVALQSNVAYGNFTLLTEFENQQNFLSLENQYWSASLSTQLSLLRLFGASSQDFNIYGSIGTGLLFNNVSVEAEGPEGNNVSNVSSSDHPGQTFFTSFGGGIRFNLGPRIDSFAQYEYNVANRDIVDGDYLGDLFELNGSAKTSNTWSVISVGVQFKFGASDMDADWPTPLLPPGQSPYADDDVFDELEERLLAQQEEQREQLYEEINRLTSQIDSLKSELASQQQLESRALEINSDTLSTLLNRIENLEQEIANEREKSEQNLQKLDELTTQLSSLQAELSDERQERREQEDLYKNNIAELQTHIDSLENELSRIRDSEQIGQTIDTTDSETDAEADSETEPTEDDAPTTPAERREDEETDPETVGRKDVESSSEIADSLATEEEQTTELAEGEDEPEPEEDEPTAAATEEEDEPDAVSEEAEEPAIAADADTVEADDDDYTATPETESEADETDETDTADMDEEEDRGFLWLIYTLIALIVAAIIYFLTRPFSSRDDDDESGSGSDNNNKGGGSPTPTSKSPDGGSTTEKSSDENRPSYPVPEHSRKIERKKSGSTSSSTTSGSKSSSTSSEAIPEHSITVDSKSKKSKSNANKSDFSSNKEMQIKAKESSKKNNFASRGYLSMTLNEVSDFFSTLFAKKSSDKQ